LWKTSAATRKNADLQDRIGRALIKAVFPEICHGCGRFIPERAKQTGTRPDPTGPSDKRDFVRRVLEPVLCPGCLADIPVVDSPICPCCGRPLKSRQDGDHMCGRCITEKRSFSKARSALIYDGAVHSLIHSYKYNSRTCLAKPLGGLLYEEFIRQFDPEEIDAVMAVPLHTRRMRHRGYNQALLMIRHWPEMAAERGHLQNWEVICHDRALCRKTHTRPQTGLDRKARAKNIKGAFDVSAPWFCKDRSLLLVDDVMTTGATLDECAKALYRAGAARVSVLTLARAL
jgi:ComF family protein